MSLQIRLHVRYLGTEALRVPATEWIPSLDTVRATRVEGAVRHRNPDHAFREAHKHHILQRRHQRVFYDQM